MRKAWILTVLTVGCLIGVPGCAGGILGSIATEAAFTALSTIMATWFSDLVSSGTTTS